MCESFVLKRLFSLCGLASRKMLPSLLVLLTHAPWALGQAPAELQAGQARFHQIVGSFYTAHALTADPATPEAHLARAQALLELGAYPEAIESLETLHSGNSSLASQTGLALVRASLAAGDLQSAKNWLHEVFPLLKREQLQEGLFYQAETRRINGDHEGASESLAKMEPGELAALGYFNLAAAQHAASPTSAQPLLTLRVAAAKAGSESETATLELADRSNLAGAALALDRGDHSAAARFLSRVPPVGHDASEALYLRGVAEFNQGQLLEALRYWRSARQFPLASTGTAESYLAFGEALARAESRPQAVEALLAASATFVEGRTVLADLESRLEDQGGYALLRDLVGEDIVETGGGPVGESTSMNSEQAWLMRFLENPAALDTSGRLVELDLMAQRLDKQQLGVAALKESLQAHRDDVENATAQSRSSGGTTLARVRQSIDALQLKARSLQNDLESATDVEGASFERNAAEENLQTVRQQIRRASGLASELADKAADAPSRIDDHLARASNMQDRLSAQQRHIETLRAQVNETITQQLRAFLAEQKGELADLKIRSDQAVAHLQESLLRNRLLKEEASERPFSISVQELAGRYRTLLQEANDPAVRIDALHRLVGLQTVANAELEISSQQERELYEAVLSSYDQTLASGVAEGDSDALLYQSARAHSFVGDEEAAITRLQQLVAEHPGSEYAAESRFRIAEHAFSLGDFATAARVYSEILSIADKGRFAEQSKYMLGWARFKLNETQEAAEHFLAVLDRYADDIETLDQLDHVAANVVDDTFRILAIIAARQGGPEFLEQILAGRARPAYEYLLYDRLADYYSVAGQYRQSAAASQAFIDEHPAHSASPALARQVVETLLKGGLVEEAMAAREAYIERFGSDERFAQMTDRDKASLLDYLDRAGRHYYRLGQVSASAANRSVDLVNVLEGASGNSESREFYARAAGYLERWTQLLDNGRRGEHLVLAADAWMRAGEPENALPLYEIAGYREGDYDEAADAAYAAVLIYRRFAEDETDDGALRALIAASEQYMRVYVEDPRARAVRAHTANLLFQRGHEAKAESMAMPLTHDDGATVQERRAGLLIVANAAYNTGEFEAAERYYQEALDGMPSGADNRRQIEDKLAAAVYRQGEVAAGAGLTDKAVADFLQVAAMSADKSVAMRARYDAADTWFAAQHWDRAIEALADFKQRYPDSDLFEAADDQLIDAYEAAGQLGNAADVLLAQADRRALSAPELWETRIAAAEWYQQAGEDASARKVYRRYLTEGTSVFGSHEYQQELRWMLAEHDREQNDSSSAFKGYRQILAQEKIENKGAATTDRSRYLASHSALLLAERAGENFRDIRLVKPLAETLRKKRAALEEAIHFYQQAESYGIAEVISQSTYAIAELYLGLARDMIESAPPQELTDLQAQQYTMLLEEQAYPFEEEAISVHERNQAMIEDRHWNPWIGRSLQSLAEIYPARYSREPRWMEWSSEEVVQ